MRYCCLRPHLIRKQYNIHTPTRTVCAVQNAIISSYMLSLFDSLCIHCFQHFNVLSNSGLSFAIFYCFCFFSTFSFDVRFSFYTFFFLHTHIYVYQILLYYCHSALRLCFVCSMSMCAVSFHSVFDSNILFCFVFYISFFRAIRKPMKWKCFRLFHFLVSCWWFSCFFVGIIFSFSVDIKNARYEMRVLRKRTPPKKSMRKTEFQNLQFQKFIGYARPPLQYHWETFSSSVNFRTLIYIKYKRKWRCARGIGVPALFYIHQRSAFGIKNIEADDGKVTAMLGK